MVRICVGQMEHARPLLINALAILLSCLMISNALHLPVRWAPIEILTTNPASHAIQNAKDVSVLLLINAFIVITIDTSACQGLQETV